MDKLLQNIEILPQIIKNLIYEYNVDHRNMMYLVHRELFQKQIHVKMFKSVFIELDETIYRYGCLKCKHCSCWFYESDTLPDPIFGKPIYCNDICKLHGICKVLPNLKKYFRL
jgi:hypothetical protein